MSPLGQSHIWAASKGAGGPLTGRWCARAQGQTRSESMAASAKEGAGQR